MQRECRQGGWCKAGRGLPQAHTVWPRTVEIGRLPGCRAQARASSPLAAPPPTPQEERQRAAAAKRLQEQLDPEAMARHFLLPRDEQIR